MFDIGFTELLLVLAVGLLILGPERLPGVIKSVTYWSRKARSSIDEAKSHITQELHIDEMEKNIDNYKNHIKAVQQTIGTSADINSVNETISKTFAEQASAITGKKSTDTAAATKVTKTKAVGRKSNTEARQRSAPTKKSSTATKNSSTSNKKRLTSSAPKPRKTAKTR